MAHALELRQRVVAAVDAGAGTVSHVATVFGVSRQWVHGLLRRRAQTGSLALSTARRGGRDKLTEADRDALAAWLAAEPLLTLEALRARLAAERGQAVAVSTVWRALQRRRLTHKKTTGRPRSAPATTWPRPGR